MDDTRLIPLSALQHYAYCPRQCALIHNEQAWAENWFTAQGQQLHQRVDRGEPETRKGIRYERAVLVSAPKLGLSGKLDLLEIDLQSGQFCPVEYKRGRAKADDWDRIQLCAQALCLEEMKQTQVNQGILWYWQSRRRELLPLDNNIRQRTLQVIEKVRTLFESGQTPPARYQAKRCKACSLIDLCNPKLGKDRSARYRQQLLNPDGAEPS